MYEVIQALLPPVVMAALFVALVFTALRATDWSGRDETLQGPADGDDASPEASGPPAGEPPQKPAAPLDSGVSDDRR